MVEKISTSALAKKREMEPKQLFAELKKAGYINRLDDKWVLTEQGARFGGAYVEHPKFGQFIVWPTNLYIDVATSQGQTYTATQLGEKYRLSPKKVNQLLSELGWIQKTDLGWKVTDAGLRMGAQQRLDKSRESEFVVWHDSILRNRHLRQCVADFQGMRAELHATDRSISSFRQKFEAKYRTLDGHYVRSKGELLIDNWLYMAGVMHAYERVLPIEEHIVCDFYLPNGKVYLQFWGSDSGEVDEAERAHTRAIYQEHGLSLIELDAKDLLQLDDVLPKKLRMYGLFAY